MSLAKKSCAPCDGKTPKLNREQVSALLPELEGGWTVNEKGHLEKSFKFKNFLGPLSFTNRIGEIAERENHHPKISLTWGDCTVEIWTHAINGLSENDFILAAKINEVPN